MRAPNVSVVSSAPRVLDELESLLGPSPVLSSPISLVDVRSDSLRGYAGSYGSATATVRFDSRLSQHTLVHELVHVWANDDVFAETWLSEGMAEFVAGYVEHGYEAGAHDRETADRRGPSLREPLVEWDTGPLVGEKAQRSVAAGYAASLAVFERIGEDVGSDRLIAYMRDVMAAARADGEPIDSYDFASGVRHALGYTDDDGLVAGLVFGLPTLPDTGEVPEGLGAGSRLPGWIVVGVALLGTGAFAVLLRVRTSAEGVDNGRDARDVEHFEDDWEVVEVGDSVASGDDDWLI